MSASVKIVKCVFVFMFLLLVWQICAYYNQNNQIRLWPIARNSEHLSEIAAKISIVEIYEGQVGSELFILTENATIKQLLDLLSSENEGRNCRLTSERAKFVHLIFRDLAGTELTHCKIQFVQNCETGYYLNVSESCIEMKNRGAVEAFLRLVKENNGKTRRRTD